ncbi:DUF3710 domain-containing protein [Nocardioides sp.]|uniref:DUF3710 domain-containing protein n=1 Tax=Nocardioides sp. TaxID=35761 RepID=UPI002B26EC6C|nr:DUF3710 domain-containing protein [Nocardioides sp.]
MKFRRKSATDVPDATGTEEAAASADPASSAESVPAGPYDAEALPDDGVERVDLGSLLIGPEEGRELRLQVDESTGNVQSVMLAGADGALELRAFAAPRNGDLWAEVRPQIAADTAQRGGTATEREGRFGTELMCQMKVQRPEGVVTQPSRIVGINGTRWLLRATLLGRPAIDPDNAADWEDVLTRVAVQRGGNPLPVGEPLPLILPDHARRVNPPVS